MIRLENVAKTYNAGGTPVHALRTTNLSIDEGEFVAIMGPSGSGKSTLLTILGTMNPPSEGRLFVDEINVYALGIERRADFRHEYVGFVFQQLQLLPYLTALENVLLPLAVSRMPVPDKKALAMEALQRVGLRGKESRLPYQLSGGEQGRVAVARAIVNRPPIVLADEPTGNLDRATGTQVLDMLCDLNGSGHTVVMVTHDVEAASYARRIVRILDGMVMDGEMAEESPAECVLPAHVVA